VGRPGRGAVRGFRPGGPAERRGPVFFFWVDIPIILNFQPLAVNPLFYRKGGGKGPSAVLFFLMTHSIRRQGPPCSGVGSLLL